MSRIRERRRDTIAPPEEGDLDGGLLLAQAGILAKIGKALDLRAGLAAITAGFAVGDTVTIADGPFADLPATVSQVNHAAMTLTVLITLFGRQTRVDVTFGQVVGSDDAG